MNEARSAVERRPEPIAARNTRSAVERSPEPIERGKE